MKKYLAKVLFVLTFLLLVVPSFSGTFNAIADKMNDGNKTYESESGVEYECTFYDDHVCIILTTPQFILEQKEECDKIFIKGFGNNAGCENPSLPMRIFSIALPPDAVFEELKCTPLASFRINGPIDFESAKSCVLGNELSYQNQDISEENSSNPEAFSNGVFPYENVWFVQSSMYRAYNLADIAVMPISYDMGNKSAVYYSRFNITIFYSRSNEMDTHFDYQKRCEEFAKKHILNYEEAQVFYASKTEFSKGLHEFVVITKSCLVDEVSALVEWEELKGKTTAIATVEWISETFEGIDIQQRIRSFLRQMYPSDQWGIEYVLIVGNVSDIPMRKTAQRLDASFEEAETDFYYAELSLADELSWDSDGDRHYAENSDSFDYFAEVSVGRIPWSDPKVVGHICAKSVTFEQNNDPSFKNNILAMGAIVDERTDGAVFMEACLNESLNPWMALWSKTRMYERSSSYDKDFVLSRLMVNLVWHFGRFGFVCYNSHGSPSGWKFQKSFDCRFLNERYPSIVSAAACSNSDSDFVNFGQCMLKRGAVGFLGANKAALYCSQWDRLSDGSDQSFKLLFCQQVTGELSSQGDALRFALSEMYLQGLWFMERYEMMIHSSLWGNPDLSLDSVESY